MRPKFYKCSICGNIVALVHEGGGTLVCCGKPMDEIIPNSTDAAKEKHVPVISVDGNTVKVRVSTVAHPMLEEHYIEWIMLETESGNQRKLLKPGSEPECTFEIASGDKVIAAYAYCNLHGLWKGTL